MTEDDDARLLGGMEGDAEDQECMHGWVGGCCIPYTHHLQHHKQQWHCNTHRTSLVSDGWYSLILPLIRVLIVFGVKGLDMCWRAHGRYMTGAGHMRAV